MAIEPQFSIIIPTHNRLQQVQKAVGSVLRQTCGDYEIIIIDDASTDGTADKIARAYPDIRLIRLNEQRGAAAARNEGIKISRGNLIAFLDSDDTWDSRYLEVQGRALQDHEDADMSICDCWAERRDGLRRAISTKPRAYYNDLVHHLLMKNFITTMSIVVVRHDALLQAGLLNDALKISHDRELYMRLLSLGGLVHIPEALAAKTESDNSVSIDYKLWAREVFTLLDMFFSSDIGQSYRKFEDEARNSWALNVAEVAMRSHRDIAFGISMVSKAWRLSPRYTGRFIIKRLKNALFGRPEICLGKKA